MSALWARSGIKIAPRSVADSAREDESAVPKMNSWWFEGSAWWARITPKSVPRRVPEGPRRGPGRVLEGSLSQVGSKLLARALFRPLLEPSWGPFGTLLGNFWALLSLLEAFFGLC